MTTIYRKYMQLDRFAGTDVICVKILSPLCHVLQAIPNLFVYGGKDRVEEIGC